jgi:hypothetical protein
MMGLADSGTVSERQAAAQADDRKITAGELAAKMRRAGLNVTAKELKPLALEWHHSGWIPGRKYDGSRMGRTYFFPVDTDIDKLYKDVLDARAETIAEAERPDVLVHYDEVVHSTKRATLYRISGREVWVGDFQRKETNYVEQTFVVSATVAEQKQLTQEGE